MKTATFTTSSGPRQLSRDEVLKGIERFDKELRGKVPDTGQGWFIQEKDHRYPPKYVVSLGTGLPRSEFWSGKKLNDAIRSVDFEVLQVEEDLTEETDLGQAEQAEKTTFTIERDMQNALRKHIDQLEHGLKITDDGKEQMVPSGRIDITAEDKSGNVVVIELKANEADRDAIGQVLAYMGDLSSNGEKMTRGILVAGDFTPRAIAAARVVPNLQLKKYGFNFAFDAVGKS